MFEHAQLQFVIKEIFTYAGSCIIMVIACKASITGRLAAICLSNVLCRNGTNQPCEVFSVHEFNNVQIYAQVFDV